MESGRDSSPISRRLKTLSISSTGSYHFPFKVRDFAHPPSSPLHYGIYPITSPTPSTTSDIDNLFPCHARAMYDFEAQDPSELSFPEGALIYILERKYPGWLLGILNDQEGLVPENYVCIEDDTSDSDDTSRPPSSMEAATAVGAAATASYSFPNELSSSNPASAAAAAAAPNGLQSASPPPVSSGQTSPRASPSPAPVAPGLPPSSRDPSPAHESRKRSPSEVSESVPRSTLEDE
ncbi:hypothetical protein BCR44DRAFT_1265835 [Catenaria anguillulae PL171]|uniref:SH3 domain-containing protein n=1 Tax=Catenaria anguillulae PL171 TaxID=765915 RepID=A0A1Y2HA93_9FUNG|nr:hypothetical protein BCR44DRAFT_1265835 [Catenaria anguillulae PL171]